MADRSKQGRASREKGKRGERELAQLLRKHGYTKARRGVQYSGRGAEGEAPDVTGIPGIHIEAKRVERLNIEKAMEQSDRDRKPDEIPTVFHRKSRAAWLVTLPAEAFLEILAETEKYRPQQEVSP